MNMISNYSKLAFWLKFLLFISSIAYSLMFCFYGLDFTDSFFYVNSISHFRDYPLWLGTSIIGKAVSLFGDSLITFRMVNGIFYLFAALIPAILLLPFPKLLQNLHWLGLSILSLNILNPNIFGIDGLTILFLSITTSLFIKFLLSHNLLLLIWTGLFSAVLIHVRFPNALIIILVVSFILLYNFEQSKSKQWIISAVKWSILYLGIVISLYLAIYVFVYHDLKIIQRISSFVTHANNSTYSIQSLLGGYLFDLNKLLKYFGFTFLFFLADKLKIVLPGYFRYAFAFAVVSVFVLFLWQDLIIDSYTRNFSMFTSSIVYGLIGYLIYEKLKLNDYKSVLLLLLITVFSLIPITGSNTRLLKLAPFLVCFAPVIKVKFNIKSTYLTIILSVVFLFFIIYLKRRSIYEDSPVGLLAQKPAHSMVSDIYTHPKRALFIDEVMKQYDSLSHKNSNIIFWGRNSHLFHYLTNTSTHYDNSFWMIPDDLNEVEKIERVIVLDKPIVFFIPYYPTEVIYDNPPSAFESMLVDNGYKMIQQANFSIFYPQ